MVDFQNGRFKVSADDVHSGIEIAEPTLNPCEFLQSVCHQKMSSILRKIIHKDDTETADKIIFMMRNGAITLKELIASSHGKYNSYRIFSIKELKQATNNYDLERVVTKGNYFKLYKDFWQDRSISVMKFYNNSDENIYEYCINNAVYAAQMNHKHIIKLIGSCLETKIPVLVFEYVEYGSLIDRIFGTPQPRFEPLLFTKRLKIAMDIAHAVAYLHDGFPRPIVFRNIKPSNILFNEQNDVKLFEFSLCMSIPEGETHVKVENIVGTVGYMAPEIISAVDLNEKCDVYSFGIFLRDLLTGKRATDLPSSTEDDRRLSQEHLKKVFEDNSSDEIVHHGIVEEYSCRKLLKKVIEANRLDEIVDPIIVEDKSCPGKEELVQAFIQLILECVNISPVDRPTMVDVAKRLRQIYRSCM